MIAKDRLQVISGHLKPQPHHLDKIIIKPASASIAPAAINDDHVYTLPNDRLTEEQRDFYEQNGFLVIPDLISPEMIDTWRARFLDIVDGRVSTGGMTKMKDITLKGMDGISGERQVNKIQDFVWDDILSEHTTHPKVLEYVECFTGANIMAMHTMLINKPPDPGTKTSRHPMHQDLHYFPFRPSKRIVCAWTAMEKIDQENGCLFVVPGSHTGQLEKHEYPEWEDGVNKMYHGVRGFDHLPKTYLPMNKGDTVFFHPILFHGSGTNSTDRFRKAISCHYAASDCQHIDVKGTTQENIAKEVEEIALKRGVAMDFKEVWKYRSRLVKGQEISL